jgi:hypothetical protein
VNGLGNSGTKPRLDLIPPVLDQVAEVMAIGADNYGPRNWEDAGMAFGSLFGALQRHTWSWWRGEDLDQDSRKRHLAHVAANALMLLQLETTGAGEDDRPRVWRSRRRHLFNRLPRR